MSFLGNFAAAQGAKAIGQYQKSIWDNEANYIIAQRNQKRTVFDQVLKPQLLDIQDSQYSDFFLLFIYCIGWQCNTTTTYRIGCGIFPHIVKFLHFLMSPLLTYSF